MAEWSPTDDELRVLIAELVDRDWLSSVIGDALARLVLRERNANAHLRRDIEMQERLRAETRVAFQGWEDVWRELGEPGPLGAFKWDACVAEIRSRVMRTEIAEAALGTARAEVAALAGFHRNVHAALARVEALCDEEDRVYAETYPHADKRHSGVTTARVRAALTGAPPTAETCRMGHDLFGACELPHGHDGPHSRVPGGATEANTWFDARCPTYDPATDDCTCHFPQPVRPVHVAAPPPAPELAAPRNSSTTLPETAFTTLHLGFPAAGGPENGVPA